MADTLVKTVSGNEVSMDARDAPTGVSTSLRGETSYAPISNSITSEALSGNEKPVSLPEVQTPTNAEGLSGLVKSINDRNKFTEETQQKAKESSSVVSNDKQSLTDLMRQIVGVQTSRADLEEKAGIDAKTEKVNDITKKIEDSSRAQENELRAIESSNMTDAGKNAATRDINRKYAFEQADYALIQSAANRDLETASNIIDRKIKLQLEPLQTQLDFTKLFYEDNKDLLSKAEDKAFQTKIDSLNKEYETEKSNRDAIGQIQLAAIQNGVTIPTSVLTQLNKAKDATEATQILASNGISLQNPLDAENARLQNQKLRSEINQTNQNSSAIIPGTKPAGKPDPLSAGYANRTISANETIDKLGSRFVSSSSIIGQFSPNVLKSDERQQYEQAQRNFVNAVLRKESGAAISPEEFSSARLQYFPQPGDGEGVIRQKEANRIDAINALIGSAGTAFDGKYLDVPKNDSDPLNLGLSGIGKANPLGI